MPEVFISHAHADDLVMVDGAMGWVTTFADRLHKAVTTEPGGSGTRVWMDHRLEPQRAVDSARAERVGRANCFVALMSLRYLESTWCRNEMDGFSQRRGGTAADRVFVIETVAAGTRPRVRWRPCLSGRWPSTPPRPCHWAGPCRKPRTGRTGKS